MLSYTYSVILLLVSLCAGSFAMPFLGLREGLYHVCIQKFCWGGGPRPEVIKPLSSSTQLSLHLWCWRKRHLSNSQSESDIVFYTMLINNKMPTIIVGILTFISMINFTLRWVAEGYSIRLVYEDCSFSVFGVFQLHTGTGNQGDDCGINRFCSRLSHLSFCCIERCIYQEQPKV